MYQVEKAPSHVLGQLLLPILIGLGLAAFAFGVAFLPWYLPVAGAVAAALVAVICFKPALGLYLTVLLLPVSEFSVSFIILKSWNRPIFHTYYNKISVLEFFLPFLLAGVLASQLARIRKIPYRDPLVAASLVLLAYAALSLFWVDLLGHGVFQLIQLILNFVVYFVVVSLVRSEAELKGLVWAYIASMAIQCVIALGLFAYETVSYSKMIVPTLWFYFKVYGGVILDTGAPNVAAGLQNFHDTALLCNMAAALSLGMLSAQKKRSKLVPLLLCLFALFLLIAMATESRAGIGAMIAMLIMLSLLLPRFQFRRARTIVLLILGSVIIYSAIHLYLWKFTKNKIKPRMVYVIEEIMGGGKLVDTGHKKKESGRMYIYRRSFRAFASRSPLAGLGVGNLKYVVHVPHAHSIYFSLILDFGLIGLLFLSALAVILFGRFYRVLRMPDCFAKTMALAATAGFSSTAVHTLVDFEYNTRYLWFFLGLLMAGYNVALSSSGLKKKVDALDDEEDRALSVGTEAKEKGSK